MKQIERPNLSKILGAFIISLAVFIVGFFLRGNSNFTIPIAMLIGALLLYVTIKIVRLFYDKYKNKSKILITIGVFGMFYIFFGIIRLVLFSFYLVPTNANIIRRHIISLITGFVLVGISYFSLKKKKKI